MCMNYEVFFLQFKFTFVCLQTQMDDGSIKAMRIYVFPYYGLLLYALAHTTSLAMLKKKNYSHENKLFEIKKFQCEKTNEINFQIRLKKSVKHRNS